MPNPYKYTNHELNNLVDQWRDDDSIVYDLKDYIMWQTRFTDEEYEAWAEDSVMPDD